MQKAENNKKKLTVIIVAAVLVVAILVMAGVGVAMMVRQQHRFDYMTDNIASYITFEGNYKDITLDISIDNVTESDIDEYIAQELVKNKNKTPKYSGAGVTNRPITLGDVAYIYYRGYEVVDGREVDFDGGCNFSSATPHELEIGSGGFIPGFELGLVGKNPKEHTKLVKSTTGLVDDGKVIYMTYSAMYPGGESSVAKRARVDLAGDVDAVWGAGFEEYIIKKEVGKKLTEGVTCKLESGDVIYYDITVEYEVESEENPVVVTAYFPYDYQEESLRCKEVFFDVYIDYVVIYDTPELDDKFITETLKISADSLAECEGETLAEKYRSSVKNELYAEYEKEYNKLVEDSLWAQLAKKTTVKSYPASAVSKVYDEYYSDLKLKYENYKNTYSSIESFAAAYFEITDGTNYRAYITKKSKEVVKEKLIFYYIARTENLLPTEDEKNAIIEDTLKEYMSYYLENDANYARDKFDSDEAYNDAVAKLRADLLKYYGQEYFDEIAYFQVASEKIMDNVTINIVSGRGHK